LKFAGKNLFDSFLERNRTFLDRAFVYARVEFAQFLVELAFDVLQRARNHTQQTFVIIIFIQNAKKMRDQMCLLATPTPERFSSKLE